MNADTSYTVNLIQKGLTLLPTRMSMTKWLVAENFRASTPCAFAVFSMSQRGIR